MPAASRTTYFAALRQPPVWRRALKLGLTVGVLQAVLNQGDHWFNHRVDGVVVLKTLLCPLLSFTIAFVSAASTHAELQQRQQLPSS
jgi:hypothetical protein